MKLCDLSIRKKLIVFNMLMILIPVLMVLIMMGGVVLSFFALTGTFGHEALLTPASGTISNYQLQLFFDSMCKEISNDNGLKNNHDLLDSCTALEKAGAQVLIYDDSTNYYLTNGTAADGLHTLAQQIAGAGDSQTFFYRGENGLVYQTTVKNTDQKPVKLLVVSKKLISYTGEPNFLGTAEWYVKLGVSIAGGLAIIIIVLTGILLAEILSKKIIVPINKLRTAANEIRNGNLDEPIDFTSRDELGQVCKDFDSMRLRLKESLEVQKKYEEGRKELIAGISHDLSTPLTSIKGYVSGLIDGIANTPEKQKHYLRTIYDTACNMDALVDNLFLFSKLDLGRIEFHMETVELGGYFEDYCSEMQNRLSQQNMQLSFSNQCSSKAYVEIDRMQFHRVLSNLLDNSVKYKKDGPGKIEITIEDNQKEICIRFADNGRGISESETAKIFDSFYRTDPARSAAVKGNGLGLSIVKQIVEQMNGHIRASGHLNNGLTISIALPKSVKGNKGVK